MNDNIFVKNLIHNDKTFCIKCGGGVGNSLGGIFYGLYLYDLYDLYDTHNLIIISIPNHRGNYNASDLLKSNEKIIYCDNAYSTSKIDFPENTLTFNILTANDISMDSEEIKNNKTFFFINDPVSTKYLNNEDIIVKLKKIIKIFDIQINPYIRNQVDCIFENKIKNKKIFGIHWRSTDSTQNSGDFKINFNKFDPYTIVKNDEFIINFDNLSNLSLGNNVIINHGNQSYQSKIVQSDQNSYILIFDNKPINSHNHNISKGIKIKDNKFILDIGILNKKYYYSSNRFLTIFSLNHLVSNLMYLSQSTKIILVENNMIFEKIYNPHKDFKRGDFVNVNIDNNCRRAKIIKKEYQNSFNISYDIIYEDSSLLSTMENNPKIIDIAINDITEELKSEDYTDLFICSDDLDMEKKLIDSFSDKYNCHNFEKKYKITKIKGLEKFPWFIDSENEKNIRELIMKGQLTDKGGFDDNGVLIGIPYNVTSDKEQVKEALIDSCLLVKCNAYKSTQENSTFPMIGEILKKINLI